MRIRILTIIILVVGACLSVAGAALAVTGVSSNGDVSTAQYGARGDDDDDDDDDDDEEIGVLGLDVDVSAAPPGQGGPPPPEQGAGVEQESAGEGAPDVTEQVGKLPDGELPFTGYAAIPILLAGLTLVAVGAITRRRLGRSGPEAAP